MLKCNDVSPLLDALLDDELDMVNRLAIETHLQTCSTCKAQWQALNSLQQKIQQQATYYKAPASLVSTIASQQTDPPVAKIFYLRRWLPSAVAAGIALLLSVGVIQYEHQAQQSNFLRDEIIAGHVRSLMANHLVDVASSDQHTVKPWFNSRIDFSPTVYDFTADGFSLVGGRLDYMHQRSAVALVYRRRQHIINLYTWPEANINHPKMTIHEQQGYRILSWHEQGMSYWAVSDLNLHDMKTFVGLIQHRSSASTKNDLKG